MSKNLFFDLVNQMKLWFNIHMFSLDSCCFPGWRWFDGSFHAQWCRGRRYRSHLKQPHHSFLYCKELHHFMELQVILWLIIKIFWYHFLALNSLLSSFWCETWTFLTSRTIISRVLSCRKLFLKHFRIKITKQNVMASILVNCIFDSNEIF